MGWGGILLFLGYLSPLLGNAPYRGNASFASQQPWSKSRETLKPPHSGVYSNPIEEYAGAFWISKIRFLMAEKAVSKAGFPEAIVLKNVARPPDCPACMNLLTRDFLDLSVEHLSSTTNILLSIPLSLEERTNVFDILLRRILNVVSSLRESAISEKKVRKRDSSTLACIAFSDIGANVIGNIREMELQQMLTKMRHYFFEATVHSMYQYFNHIAVYVANSNDKEKVLNMSLPIWKVIDISSTLATVPKSKYFRSRPLQQLLPKYALLDVASRLRSPLSYEWERFSSIFYNEGDQILHLRKVSYFIRVMSASGGRFLFIPHRLQTLPLYEDFPPHIQAVWSYRKIESPINLVAHDPITGSCCDNGRLNLPDCKNWWYFCEEWGVKNYTTWAKFHPNGFTNALVTEHQGLCEFSPTRRKCPLPPLCREVKVPSISNEASEASKIKFAQEFSRQMQYCGENVNRAS